MAILPRGEWEADFIDTYGQRVSATAPLVTQADDPNEDLQTGLKAASIPDLPDPSVGGRFGSRIRNGFSTGIQSFFTRTQRFTGAVATPPPITNGVQGEVGMNNRASKLYAGVMDQIREYQPAADKSYVGFVTANIPVARGAK